MFPTEDHEPKLKGFDVLERIGAGGVGRVYLARSRGGRLVAIKMLADPTADLDPSRRADLAREASLAARLSHPAIVQVRAFVEEGGYAALVYEYVEGPSLARLLRVVAREGGRLPDRVAAAILERVLSALAHAHAHQDEQGRTVPIVHRDVSPANVLLDWEGAVKLTDFGMAKMLGTSTGTRLGLVRGTLGCMAPEQARGESVDERADVYAAGLLCHWLFSGRAPFARFRDDEAELLRAMRHPRLRPLDELRPDLPRTIVDAVSRALRVEPAERSVTAAELAEAVAGSLDVGRGGEELRDLLEGRRAALQVGGEPGASVDTTGRVGVTSSYEAAARAVDPNEADAFEPRDALPPIAVTPSIGRPATPFVPTAPRGALPSLHELTVLSALAASDDLEPDSAQTTGVFVSPTLATTTPLAAPRAEPKDASGAPRASRASRESDTQAPAGGGLILLVALVGAGVGVAVAAWFFR